jgi:cell wall-associated NlpC family hydrolase
MLPETRRILEEVINSWLGVPYTFGGNTRAGVDCSGFVCDVLRAGGALDAKDYSSQMLYDHYLKDFPVAKSSPKFGCLLFFGTGPQGIRHVSIAVGSKFHVEAGGGGRGVSSVGIARAVGAEVRYRPITDRPDLVVSVYPKYQGGV